MSDKRNRDTPAFLASALAMTKAPGVFFSFSKLGYQKRSKNFLPATSMVGKTVAITGANSGIGLAAAKDMIARGAKLWLLCRNRERAEVALAAIRQQAKDGGTAEIAIVDVANLRSVREVIGQIKGEGLDALIHNAGVLNKERVLTDEGLEPDFALHLAGPHLLTKLLLPKLRLRGGRVIFVSSGGMYSERLSLATMDWSQRRYDGVAAYAQVKRAQVVLTKLWAEAEPAVEFHAMHPGWVDTPGVETSLPRFYRLLRRWLRTPAQGADTITWLASAAELPGATGLFWLDREPVTPYLLPNTREADDEPAKLWTALEAAVTPQ